MPTPGFFAELKRRNVLRAAAFYVAAVWAISQGISQLSPAFGMPDWVTRWFVIACAIGFPFWVTFAWFYEWTPHGLKRESEIERSDSTARQTGRALDRWIIGALAVAVVLLGSGYFIRRQAPAVATRASMAAFNPPADSIVVLPFANLSDDPKQQYFSNGITEELTGALGQNTGLTVIAWDTAARYRASRQAPAEIGKALNVAHILDGSIQRQGDEVRVSAELVSTVTGRQLWSAHYDDSLKNIFAVQDKISAAIADALKVKFAGMQRAPTQNPHAHELYLKGLAALDRYTAADAEAAEQYFRQAVKLDPGYADAWAALADAQGELTEISTLPLAGALANMRDDAQRALTLDPHNVNALIQLGSADAFDGHNAQAAREFKQAIALDPSNAHAHLDYANVLPPEQGVLEEKTAARLDPDSAVTRLNLAVNYQRLGNWPQMVKAAKAIIPLSPHNTDAAVLLAFAYTEMQRGEDAVQAFDLVQPRTASEKQLMDAGRLTYQAVLDPTLRRDATAALDGLRRDNLSLDAQFSLLQFHLALGEKQTALAMLPDVCRAAPYGCNDLAINPMYASLHGDPRFEQLSKQYTTMMLGAAPASASSR